jgi:hypothetical protein
MPRDKDIFLNTNGDIEVGHDGDFACSYDDDVKVDGIIFRLKTQRGDYALEPECGAGLEDFIGRLNTPELGAEISTRVVESLTYDRFLEPKNIRVDVAPLSASELVISVYVAGTVSTYTVLSSLDLLTGRIKTVK